MGEQGSESIHAYFNSLGRTYLTILDRVEKMSYMMKEHYIHITALPPFKKRRRMIVNVHLDFA